VSPQNTDKMANAFDVTAGVQLGATERDLIERRDKLLGPAYRLFYAEPLHIVRGEGVWLYDASGQKFLDAYNNVTSLGHCHPHVVEAIARQAATLATHTRYLHEGILDYAERLLATCPEAIGHLMLTCTGSEANDLALRIARAATGSAGFIVTDTAYHGVTGLVAEISPSLGRDLPLAPHVRTVPGPSGDNYRTFATSVQAAIDDLAAHGLGTAALICDTIFSSDGVVADPPGFLREAVQAVHRAGGLFIADEVQAGFARTGDAMWGFQRHDLVPDLITMGKPMGNGYPVAGVAMRPALAADFGRKSRYFNTFGGNPVAVAAAGAVLDVIEREALRANAARIGRLLRTGIEAFRGRFPQIGAVRGAGLFIGVDIVDPNGVPDGAAAARVVNSMRRRHVLISCTGHSAHVLKIRPPLILTESHAQQLLDALEQSLGSLPSSNGESP
jgi:4-aminobutyrate aminotransferase-like enzyme